MDLKHGVSADLIIFYEDYSLPHAGLIRKYLQRAYCILRQRIPVVKRKKRYDEGRRDLQFKELEVDLVMIYEPIRNSGNQKNFGIDVWVPMLE